MKCPFLKKKKNTSLFSGNTWCSTLILYLPSCNPEIGHFSEESMVPFSKKYSKNQDTHCAHCYWGVTASRSLQKRTRKYIPVYMHTYIPTYLFTFSKPMSAHSNPLLSSLPCPPQFHVCISLPQWEFWLPTNTNTFKYSFARAIIHLKVPELLTHITTQNKPGK